MAMVFILGGSSENGAHIWSNQVFRFVKGSWVHRMSRQIRFFLERPTSTCATCLELPSYISTMGHTSAIHSAINKKKINSQ